MHYDILSQAISYVSEAAASLLDGRLGLYIVPPTHLVSLASPVRNYSFFKLTSYFCLGFLL
jgi:hypothetical protein